jgi:hypothetical protein
LLKFATLNSTSSRYRPMVRPTGFPLTGATAIMIPFWVTLLAESILFYVLFRLWRKNPDRLKRSKTKLKHVPSNAQRFVPD